jgi:hypothetical protein
MGQRITGMTSGQNSLPVAGTILKFEQHGQSGKWLSELIARVLVEHNMLTGGTVQPVFRLIANGNCSTAAYGVIPGSGSGVSQTLP